jgi:hypothetical protein
MARPPGKKFERLKGYEKIYETKPTEEEDCPRPRA